MKKILTSEWFLYLFFGVCTSVVNLITYIMASRLLNLTPSISTAIAWFVGVLFAYVTNRIFVFCSKAESLKEVCKECFGFFLARILTGAFETFGIWFFAEKLAFNDIFVKIVLMVIVTLANYFLSKFVVFSQKKEN